MDINFQIQNLKAKTTIVLASEGEWSFHDLLPLFLLTTGPAVVSVASFSLSEEAVRVLNFEKEKGNISCLYCLFDYTMRSHKIDIMLFLSNITSEIRTTPNHAKIMLIENNEWRIGVVGSANLTPNPRLEIIVGFVNSPEYDLIKNIFSKAWNQAIPYT